MAMKTQGSDLYVLVPAEGTGDAEIVLITCVTALTGVGAGTADQIDVTCLSELSDRQYEPGLKSPGAVSGSVNYSSSDTSIPLLQRLADECIKTQWFVGFADGSVAGVDQAARPRPTLVSDVPTFPATRTFVEFTGFVSEFGMDIDGNSVVKLPLSIQRSGPKIIHKATAPLVPTT